LQKSKTKGGVRTIPLNGDALNSAKELLIRAERLGASQPDHYLIPALVNGMSDDKSGIKVTVRRYDPTKPTKGWRTAWRKLTEKAGLRGLRGHDLRHNWITSHAEIGTPQSVLEAQAGHLSKRMSDQYKHISEKAARKASDELSRIKTAQRTEARMKLQERARAAGDSSLVNSVTVPAMIDAADNQLAVVH
jgi:integrase